MVTSQRIWTPTKQIGLFAPRRNTPSNTALRHLLVWNIGHPALTRAESQAEWLLRQSADVIVLTETCDNEGCRSLQERLFEGGYDIVASIPPAGEFGTVIASRCPLELSTFVDAVTFLPSRIAAVRLPSESVELIGVYVPNRDASEAKIARKQDFLRSLGKALVSRPRTSMVFCGDLNLIPRDHVPRYTFFKNWEYRFFDDLRESALYDTFTLNNESRQGHSWVGQTGDGYRYDYCFVSSDLTRLVSTADFDHDARRKGLSDHAALHVRFAVPEN